MKPLKILQILFTLKATSGPYNQHSLAVADKHDIAVCTYFKPRLNVSKAITLFAGDDTLRGFFRALKTALAAKDYDVIHAHSPHVGFLFVVATVLMLGKFRHRSMYTVHNSYQNYKLRNKLLMIPVFAYFRRVVCCGRACFESYPGFYKWLAGERLSSIPNGVDIDRVDRVTEKPLQYSPNGHYIVASVGRLIPIKNPLCVLSAFQQSADQASRLVFIGEGRLRGSLMKAIKNHDLAAQVELTGLVPRDQVFESLSKADVVISASRGEGLPNAVIEAMACGCPVILSDIAPHREIAGGANFIPLIPPEDVTGFAREMQRYKQMPTAARAEIGARCRKLVEERFSLATMHKRYEEVYAQVIGSN